MKLPSVRVINLLIIVIGAVLFFPFLGSVHLFDWDENIFAESAREMLITGNFVKVQSNYLPFEEKPPFFFWLQSLSMILFGVNEFAARFPNAIAGIAVLLVLFNLGRKYWDKTFGIFWALSFIASFLPHLYFRTGVIDPIFNLLIFLGLFYAALVTATDKEHRFLRRKRLLLSSVFIGFAVLTKGPVAVVIVLFSLFIFMGIRKDFSIVSWKEILLYAIPVIVISFGWYGVDIIENGPLFITEFIEYQYELITEPHSGHSGPFFYHFIVLLLGCFPAVVFIFRAFKKQEADNAVQRILKVWMLISFAFVLLLFSAVSTKLPNYSYYCYYPISFLTAYGMHHLWNRRLDYGRGTTILLLTLGTLFGIALTALPLFLMYKEPLLLYLADAIKDPFAIDRLSVKVSVSGWELLIGIAMLGLVYYAGLKLRKNTLRKILVLFCGMVVLIELAVYTYAPKVEEILQGEAIRFYKEKGQEDAYLYTMYKSFAVLFYGKKEPGYDVRSLDREWLMHGEIDKPVYFIERAYKADYLKEEPEIEKLYEMNGFAFFRRDP